MICLTKCTFFRSGTSRSLRRWTITLVPTKIFLRVNHPCLNPKCHRIRDLKFLLVYLGPSRRGAFYGFTMFFFFFSFSFSPRNLYTLPEKEGPSTFACKSKNACGRIGIFAQVFHLFASSSVHTDLTHSSILSDQLSQIYAIYGLIFSPLFLWLSP